MAMDIQQPDNRGLELHRLDRNLKWARRRDIILTLIGWGIVIAFIGWLLGFIVETLVILAFAFVIALVLTPLVKVFMRVMPRSLAILCAYIMALIVVLALGYWVGMNLSQEVSAFIKQIPTYRSEVQNLLSQTQSLLSQHGIHVNMNPSAIGNAIFTQIGNSGTALLGTVAGIITTVASVLAGIIIAIVISVYLVIDGPRALRTLRTLVPQSHRGRTVRIQRILNRVLGGYVRGQLTLAVLVGVLVGIGMFLLGVPYAVILGFFAFLFEFVPIIGVVFSGALCVIFALTVSPLLVVWVLLYFIGVHVFEGDVVGPRIVGNAVGLHPAISIIALVAGAEVGGLLGALFAVPIAGTLQALAIAVYDEIKPPDAATLPTTTRPRQGEEERFVTRAINSIRRLLRRVPWLNELPGIQPGADTATPAPQPGEPAPGEVSGSGNVPQPGQTPWPSPPNTPAKLS
jgi:predicted PurR-regulated permease PerM